MHILFINDCFPLSNLMDDSPWWDCLPKCWIIIWIFIFHNNGALLVFNLVGSVHIIDSMIFEWNNRLEGFSVFNTFFMCMFPVSDRLTMQCSEINITTTFYPLILSSIFGKLTREFRLWSIQGDRKCVMIANIKSRPHSMHITIKISLNFFLTIACSISVSFKGRQHIFLPPCTGFTCALLVVRHHIQGDLLTVPPRFQYPNKKMLSQREAFLTLKR